MGLYNKRPGKVKGKENAELIGREAISVMQLVNSFLCGSFKDDAHTGFCCERDEHF